MRFDHAPGELVHIQRADGIQRSMKIFEFRMTVEPECRNRKLIKIPVIAGKLDRQYRVAGCKLFEIFFRLPLQSVYPRNVQIDMIQEPPYDPSSQ